MIDARGRCGGDVHHVGDRGGDEPVQRRRSGDNRIARVGHNLATMLVAASADLAAMLVAASRRIRQPCPEGAVMADRQYELVYILPPDTTEQQVTELHEQIEAGRVAPERPDREDRELGPPRLAYEIGQHKEGVYVLEVINGSRRADEGARSPAEGDGPGHPAHDRARRRGEEGRRPHAHQAADRIGAPPRQARPAAAAPAGRRPLGRRADDADDDRFDGVEV